MGAFYLITFFIGVLISVMVALNGGLSAAFGLYPATVIIHLAGLLVIAIVVAVKKENPFKHRQKWFLYCGGIIGVLTVIFNNIAFGKISVSAIMALGLFGQSLSGLLIDHFGLMGMPRRAFRKDKIPGFFVSLAGIAAMITAFDPLALLVSFATGITVVTSRTVNARLAAETSVNASAFFNNLTGSALSILILPIACGFNMPSLIWGDCDWYLYLGGALGIFTVILCNVVVSKVSSFYFSLFLFIGQVFSGIIIDAVIDGSFAPRLLAGGLLVSAGLCLNLLTDKKRGNNNSKTSAS